MGIVLSTEPNPDASKTEVLRALWTGAGLEAVETREIAVRRSFDDFDDYWTSVQGGPAFAPILKALAPKDLDGLKGRLRARVPAGADGRIVLGARANAVKGRVPA